jgi:drug/metabolite transporter (DMT)-like permease
MQRPGGTDAVLMSIAVLAVATSGPLMAATAAPALAIAFWRNALGSAAVVPAALLTARAELRGLDRRERRLALVAGVFLALHFATWVPALDYTTVASATALVATQPVWVALIARRQGVDVSGRVWAGIAVAMVGALLLTGADGVFAAAYMTAGSAVRRSVSTTTYTALCYSTCAALLLVVCVVGRQELSGYDGETWLKLLAITAGAQLLGHSLFNVVLRSISATVVSLSILLEIPGAALIAAVFLGQRPPVLAIPAALLLLAGLAIVIRDSTRVSVPVE